MNLFKENDVGRAMRFLPVLFAVFTLTFAPFPVSAQSATPTPSPTVINNSWIADAVQFVQAVGTSGALSLIMSVGFVLLIYRTFKPMLDSAREDRAELRAEREEREKERQERQQEREERQLVTAKMAIVIKEQADDRKIADEQRAKVTEVLAMTAKHLGSLATRDEDQEHSNENALKVNNHTDEARDAINKHMEELIEPLRKDVNALAEQVEKRATIDQIRDALQPLQDHLDNISQNAGDFLRATHTGKTDNLNPQVALDAEAERGIVNGSTDSTKEA